MTLKQFMLYTRYSMKCPEYINPFRWAAMLKSVYGPNGFTL